MKIKTRDLWAPIPISNFMTHMAEPGIKVMVVVASKDWEREGYGLGRDFVMLALEAIPDGMNGSGKW